MKNLLIFCWSFENQLDTLHPPHRQDNMYCLGLRSQCAMVFDFFGKWGSIPSLFQGIVEFAKCKDMITLLKAGSSCRQSKMMTCNVVNALNFCRFPNDVGLKPTVEFRQHEGTLDGERIVKWVKLLIGIVQRLEEIHPESLLDLFSQVQNETWEKTDQEGINSANQSQFGPVPAESSFTMIDLLEWMGLDESADYYRDRLFFVKGKPKTPLRPGFIFEKNEADAIPNRAPADSKAAFESLQRIWHSMMLVSASAQEVDGVQVDFNPHDPLWPRSYRECLWD